MDSGLNSAAANTPFDHKKILYAASRVEITRTLANVDEWTLEAIQERQNALADKAVEVWPIAPRA